jgi:hypothetical protein
VDTFRYKAKRGDGAESNIAQVTLVVLAGCSNSLGATSATFAAEGGPGSVQSPGQLVVGTP